MASSSASNLSKAISKIASSPAGSPPSKKLIATGMSASISSAPDSPFRKPVALSKPLSSKKVTATLSVQTPTRRPPSLPISPWNAEPINQTVTELTNAVNKAVAASCVTNKFKTVKAKVDTGKTAPRKSVTAAMLKISDSTRGPTNPKIISSKSQLKSSVQVKSSKSKTRIKPTDSRPVLTDTIKAPTTREATFNDRMTPSRKQFYKTNLLKPSASTSFRETDLETKSAENTVGEIYASFSLSDDTKSKATESSPTAKPKYSFITPNKNTPSSTSATSGTYTPRAGSPNSQGSLGSPPTATKNRLSGDRSRSLYDTPMSPRVFERQYDTLADALFAPYITDDSYDTGMGSSWLF